MSRGPQDGGVTSTAGGSRTVAGGVYTPTHGDGGVSRPVGHATPNGGSDPLVVGLDLSLTRSGIAISQGVILSAPSTGKDADTLHQRHLRAMDLSTTVISAAYSCGRPALVVVEGPAHGARGGKAHDRSGLWWQVVHALLLAGTPVAEAPPHNRAKYATGNGRADKDTCLAAAIKRFGEVFDIKNNDEADAATLCAMGRDWLGHPLVKVPAIHRQALDGCAWPVPGETV